MSDQSNLIAAYQTAATADLAILSTLEGNEATPFTTLQNALTAAAATLNDPARQSALTQIGAEVAQAKIDFLTLISLTTAAQTDAPNI